MSAGRAAISAATVSSRISTCQGTLPLYLIFEIKKRAASRIANPSLSYLLSLRLSIIRGCEAPGDFHRQLRWGKLKADGGSLAILSWHRHRNPPAHRVLDRQGPYSPRLRGGDLALLRHLALSGMQDIHQEKPPESLELSSNNVSQVWARSNEALGRKAG
jgi:hypothetical protein